ncbi:ATP/GTP-binding protein [Streptomyces chrestomyceticus]|uniref:ATP/GTP-binding protein n=1 Tax=Streptomyces chrestomyceticus TaxID=68185 RepID=UPI0033E82A67
MPAKCRTSRSNHQAERSRTKTSAISAAPTAAWPRQNYFTAPVAYVLVPPGAPAKTCTTTGAQTTDLLKDLTERLPATFVYAGINVTDTPLFRGAQLAGRATLIVCGPLPPATAPATPSATSPPTSKTPLTSTNAPPVASDPSPDSSAKPPSPLSNGTERIAKTTLDAVQRDHLAEQHARPTPNR